MKSGSMFLIVGVVLASVLLAAVSCGGAPAVPDPPVPVIDADRSADDSRQSGIQTDWMDTSISPGDDFYSYACGSWAGSTAVPEGLWSYSGFDTFYDALQEDLLSLLDSSEQLTCGGSGMAQTLYRSGLNNQAIELADIAPLEYELELIDDIHDAESFSFALGHLQRIGVSPFFELHRPLPWELLDWNYLYFRQTSLGISDGLAGWYEADEEAKSVQVIYMSELLTELDYSSETALEYSERILSLEEGLSEHSMSESQLRDFQQNYNPISPEDLTDRYGEIHWGRLMDGLGTAMPSKVVLGQPDYLSEVNTIIGESDWELLKAYLKWALAAEFAPALSARFSEPAMRYNEYLFGNSAVSDELRMLGVVRREMPDVLGAMYLEKFFPETTRERVEIIIANLKVAYDRRIRGCIWLDESTRAYALSKLSTVTFAIGGRADPEYYSGLELTETGYLPNILALRQLRTDEHLSCIDEPVSDDVWFLEAYVANRWSLPSSNTVLLPAAGINELFRSECDDAYNYGAFGSTIAHEITHLFDRTGRTIDGDGRQRNWWTQNDLSEYEALTTALIDYFEFLSGEFDLALNSENMFDENFADVMGLRVAYDAYLISLDGAAPAVKNGFTGQQRLFLANAQKWRVVYTPEGLESALSGWHSPGQIRAAGPAFLNEGFPEAFPEAASSVSSREIENLGLIW